MARARAAVPAEPWPASHRLLLALLMLLAVLPAPFSTVILDTARDLDEAARIAAGDALPLRGPVINAMVHLGPLWFYLLAIPLAATGSIAVTLGFAALLGALKYPLAYALGRRLGGARLGLALALILALPGWNSAALLLVSHTSAVEAALLAALLALAALAGGGPRRGWLGYGLAQSLALHAHPATIVTALLLPLVLWRRRRRLGSDLGAIAAGVALALLPFLPVLVAEQREGWPALATLRAFATGRAEAPWFDGTLALARGATLGGIELVARGLASRDLGPVLRVLYAVVGLAALVGIGHGLTARRAAVGLALAAALALLALLALALLRTETPFYMALAWLPFAALPLALGLARLAEAGAAAWRALAWLAAAAAVLLSLAASALLVQRAEQGLAELPVAALGNVRLAARHEPTALLPAWRLDALGREVCAEPRRTIVHGDLALLLDSALGLSVRLACGDRSRLGIGGGANEPGARHLLGLTPRQLERGGYRDAHWGLATTLAPLRVIAADQSQPLPDGSSYPFRTRAAGMRHAYAIAFEAPAGARVVVSHPYFVYDDARTVAVSADGVPAERLAATRATEIYAAGRADGAPVRWVVEIDTGFPERIDVVVAPVPARR